MRALISWRGGPGAFPELWALVPQKLLCPSLFPDSATKVVIQPGSFPSPTWSFSFSLPAPERPIRDNASRLDCPLTEGIVKHNAKRIVRYNKTHKPVLECH